MDLRRSIAVLAVTVALPPLAPVAASAQLVGTPDAARSDLTAEVVGCRRTPRPDRWVDASALPALGGEPARDPLVSSHRGARYLAPENTLPAFEIAIAYGVDLLETDIRRSADGHYVVIHDDDVDRTTDGTGAVADLTLAELRALDARVVEGQDWTTAFPEPLRIPTLEEVLALARDHGVGLELDLKVSGPDVQVEVPELVARYGLIEQSVFNNVDVAISQRYPGARFIYNTDTVEPPGTLYALATGSSYDVFGSRLDEFTPGRLAEIADACAQAMPHSYDEGPGGEREQLRLMRELGIGAQTDQPDLAAAELSGPVATTLRIGPVAATPGRLALTTEELVDGNTHKQGVARVDPSTGVGGTPGWVHSWNEGLVRTDDDDLVQAINPDAIPAALAAQGFDHISDPDAHAGVLYVPIEQGDYAALDQKVVRFDPATLQPLDAPVITLPISHIAWLSVTQAAGADPVLWTASDFTDVTTIQRFALRPDGTAEPLPDLALSQTLQRLQGGDVGPDGTLWLSTDDAGNRLFGVDPDDGTTTEVGSMGHLRAGGDANLTGPAPLDGLAKAEGEGIDATPLPAGLVHTLAIDALRGVSHFAHFAHRSVMPAVPEGQVCLVNAGNGAPIPYADLGRGMTTGADGCTRRNGQAVPEFAGTDAALPADRHPLHRAHAHNDYEPAFPDGSPRRPLLDALEAEFTSVEADVYLVGDQLLVGHDPDDLRPDRTLQALYLDPLRERVRRYGGVHRADELRFQLLIDVKGEAETTWRVLDAVLADYEDVLTAFGPDHVVVERPVEAIISGNRARAAMAGQAVRYASYDGRIPDDLDVPAGSLISLVSQNHSHLGWDGTGQPTAEQTARLVDAVTRAHAAGRTTRFWATPHDERVWQWLHDHGSDWIGADDLDRLEAFLRAQP